MHDKCCAYGYSLLFASAKGGDGSMSYRVEAEQIEYFFHALSHDIVWEVKSFHSKGKLFFNDIGDESIERILADNSNDMSKRTRLYFTGRDSVYADISSQYSAGVVGD
jgi:hypothetical protein